MNTVLPDKQLVENISLGTFAISIQGSQVWAESDKVQLLQDVLIRNWVQAVNSDLIPHCSVLRLIVVASDFTNEVAKWSALLEENWRVSSDGAVGQTFVWGDGKHITTYAVVILSEEIALGFINDVSFSSEVLLHEFAHIHNDFLYLNYFGALPKIKPGDWRTVREFIAYSVWGEYFAESIVYRNYDSEQPEENIQHAIVLLKNALVRIKDEITLFQRTKEVTPVWATAINTLSSAFNHFGRVLGYFSSTKQRSKPAPNEYDLYKNISEISNEWEQIIKQLSYELTRLSSENAWQSDKFEPLGQIIDNVFRNVGFEPYKR